MIGEEGECLCWILACAEDARYKFTNLNPREKYFVKFAHVDTDLNFTSRDNYVFIKDNTYPVTN